MLSEIWRASIQDGALAEGIGALVTQRECPHRRAAWGGELGPIQGGEDVIWVVAVH